MRALNKSFRLPEVLNFRAEHGLSNAVVEAARRQRTSASEYLRRAVRNTLVQDGVPLPPVEPVPAHRGERL